MRGQNGYTLLHAVFTLSIFLLAAACVPVIMNGVLFVEAELAPSKEYEWNLFSQQFRQEFRGAENIKVTDTSITFTKSGEEVLYERYGDFLRRRVNKRGHELVLGPLQEIKLSSSSNGLEIAVTYEGELEWAGRFFTYGE
ncbi:hypothetical protein FZC79_10580 [Rossellomorea vietnamensis]|uniref:Competence protein ComGF n=1 Tax=Rossellomorea vietnamensis TaxID=218284 RepID=A0A5D4KE69_9BACI|nr:competence type IV pilus minor pilin ComGF [Rossellomorea vietnamensis]TYR75604.1 hypothetical protein FZC79_10580 [Rossellomorea vietnamensis]